MNQRKSIYIVGAQCSGKTTLVAELERRLHQDTLISPTLHTITEVARNVLRTYQFSREDLQVPARALELQQLILDAQHTEEMNNSASILLCDRSGIDPIVYAHKFAAAQDGAASLLSSHQWAALKNNMQKSLVILCPPHVEWLTDDGTRLMEGSIEEWEETHRLFSELLQQNDIPFYPIPGSIVELPARAEYVLQLWNGSNHQTSGDVKSM